MISITRSVTTLIAVFALATVCLAQEHAKATELGNGAEFKGKTTEMKDKGEVAYVLSFKAGKEFEATIMTPMSIRISSHYLALPTPSRLCTRRQTQTTRRIVLATVDITFSPVLAEAEEENAMVYLQASIRLRPGKLPDFIALLNNLAPVLAKRGMKLMGSYASVVGRINTVVDFWELPDANALQAALTEPELQKFLPQIHEIIEDETQVLLTKLPIG